MRELDGTWRWAWYVMQIQNRKVLRFHRFHEPVAAERPALLVSFIHSVAAVRPSVLTMLSFVFSYARGRFALTGRFPRNT